jgi:hypothetical protein
MRIILEIHKYPIESGETDKFLWRLVFFGYAQTQNPHEQERIFQSFRKQTSEW